ncbi:putative conserved membrane protein [Babesia divergens]|uniref:Conserved membrane protein n=1 Tax=Babesia divergens TaxID=32595 RepID=A0AAD9LFJ7_BABDI|nr:putative conserved membrane protein [Babesia divergens]
MYEIVNSLDASKYDFCFISDKDDHFTMETYREKFLHLVRPNMETKGPPVGSSFTGDAMAQDEDRFYKVAVPKSGRTSVLTTFLTAVQAFVQSLVILYRIRPDVCYLLQVITNGPGIAVPLCYAAVFLKVSKGIRCHKLTNSRSAYYAISKSHILRAVAELRIYLTVGVWSITSQICSSFCGHNSLSSTQVHFALDRWTSFRS